MGLFSKTPKPPFAEKLTRAEQDWLRDQRQALTDLCAAARLPADPTEPLKSADMLIRWWHSQPESSRIDANLIVNSVGVALGDALAHQCALEWMIITDSYGTDLGLWWKQGEAMVILTPTHSVAKKFGNSPDGFVEELFSFLKAHTDELKQTVQH